MGYQTLAPLSAGYDPLMLIFRSRGHVVLYHCMQVTMYVCECLYVSKVLYVRN